MAVGCELHMDGEVALIERENSKNENLWGINLYPDKESGEFIEFDSILERYFMHFAIAARRG